jgi:predicted molibdopterin-dependent oxidoreductase YjgC
LLSGAKRPVLVLSEDLAPAAVEALGALLKGRPGWARALVLRQSGNARGKQDMGLHPGRLPGGVALKGSGAAARFEEAWGGKLPSEVGMGRAPARQALKTGKVGAALILNTDPYGLSLKPKDIKTGVFTVVLDLTAGTLADRADVLLPAASLAELSGTVTTLDGQVLATRALRTPAGDRTLFSVLTALSAALGKPVGFGSPVDLWQEIGELVPRYKGFRPPPVA